LLRAIPIHEIKAALSEQVGHTASLGERIPKSRLYASIFSGLQIQKCVFHGYFTTPTSRSCFPPASAADNTHGKRAQQAWTR